MAAANVKKCICEHEYQDKKYGKGNRLHNPTSKNEWRCTVCEKIKKE